MSNSEAARRAEKELGANIKIIRKTSPEYAGEKYPPPCPSILVNGSIIAMNVAVTYEALKAAVMTTAAQEGGL